MFSPTIKLLQTLLEITPDWPNWTRYIIPIVVVKDNHRPILLPTDFEDR